MGRFSIHPSVCLSLLAGWLAGTEAWLAEPEARLAGPEAWLAEYEACLTGPEAWLAGPEA